MGVPPPPAPLGASACRPEGSPRAAQAGACVRDASSGAAQGGCGAHGNVRGHDQCSTRQSDACQCRLSMSAGSSAGLPALSWAPCSAPRALTGCLRPLPRHASHPGRPAPLAHPWPLAALLPPCRPCRKCSSLMRMQQARGCSAVEKGAAAAAGSRHPAPPRPETRIGPFDRLTCQFPVWRP